MRERREGREGRERRSKGVTKTKILNSSNLKVSLLLSKTAIEIVYIVEFIACIN